MTQIYDDLNHHYTAMGISPLDFQCVKKRDCKGDSEDFIEAREAFVGTQYECGTLPRLLFVSLDSGSNDDSEPFSRTMAGMRVIEEDNCVVSALPKGKHWYETHELAWQILRRFSGGLSLEEVHRFFAHTNSAKCCQRKARRAQADSRLFTNCRPYLAGEILALQPEIIVTQGDYAKLGLEAAKFHKGRNVVPEWCTVLHVGNREVLWIHSYHPANYGRYYPQKRECWDAWIETAFDMFRDGKRPLVQE